MRVGLDATPLLGRPTGVGRYVAGLTAGLRALPDPPELVAVPFTWRGARELGGRRAPARLLRELWARTELVPVEWLAGRLDVFHATNYVLPPTRRAGGVVTVHDLTYLHHPEWVSAESRRYRELVPRSLRRAAAVCTVSHAVRAELLEAYPQVPPERLVVTPNAVDDEWFSVPRHDGGYVLFVGTLEPRKNLRTLLAAYAGPLAGQDVPRLVVAGPPGWGETVGEVPPNVELVGYVAHADLPGLVAGASCFVLPSRYEGFGIPPLEAFATGVPAVVGDVPAMREVLGPHARYHPPEDVDALADALLTTLADDGPTTAAQRRAHARQWTWRRCAEATLQAYGAAAR